MQSASEQITQLLQSWNQGDQGAIEKLVPLVYDELHRLARQSVERPGSGEPANVAVERQRARLFQGSSL